MLNTVLQQTLLVMMAEDEWVRAELAADSSLYQGYHPHMVELPRTCPRCLTLRRPSRAGQRCGPSLASGPRARERPWPLQFYPAEQPFREVSGGRYEFPWQGSSIVHGRGYCVFCSYYYNERTLELLRSLMPHDLNQNTWALRDARLPKALLRKVSL